jgi:hypothetical protein
VDAKEKLKLARQKLLEAEKALNIQMHSPKYDHESCGRLAEKVRAAREEFLDQLSKFSSEK